MDGSFKITLNNTEVKDGNFEYKEADSTDTKKQEPLPILLLTP